MPGPTGHSTNAHGLVIGDVKNRANGKAVQQLIRTFVNGQGHVDQQTSVVSLFEDSNNRGKSGDTIAAQVDLDIPASDPAAHQALEDIEDYMNQLPAPNDFKPGTVRHY
jgi:hypothetical protein